MVREETISVTGLLLFRRYQRSLFHLASSHNCFEGDAQTTRDDQQPSHSDPFYHSKQIFSVLLLPLFLCGKPYGPACKPERYGIGLLKGIFRSYRKWQRRVCCLISWFQLPMLTLGPAEQSWTASVCRLLSLKRPSCNPNVSQSGSGIHMGTVTLSPAVMIVWWDWKLP